MSLAERRALPDLVGEHLGTHRRRRRGPVRRPINEAGWSDGALVYVPRNARPEQPISLTAIQQAARPDAQLAHADRARGGRRGRGLGALRLRRRRRRRACFNGGHRADRRRRARTSATSATRTSPRAPGSSPPSAPRSSATRNLDWVALGFGSANGKVRMETKLAGRGAERPGHRRLRRRRPPAPRLRHDPGARAPRTRPPTSPSAASSTAARPRSGAG